MPDPSLIAAQDSARAAWAAVWTTLSVGLLSVFVNGVLAWLAFDGPRKQRHADQARALQAMAQEAGKVVNLQLGGLQVCRGVFTTADELLSAAQQLNNAGVETFAKANRNLYMQIRLIQYFLGKDIFDATVVHLLMKTQDAANNLLQATRHPGLSTVNAMSFTDVRRVVEHVRAHTQNERAEVERRIVLGSAFIDNLANTPPEG